MNDIEDQSCLEAEGESNHTWIYYSEKLKMEAQARYMMLTPIKKLQEWPDQDTLAEIFEEEIKGKEKAYSVWYSFCRKAMARTDSIIKDDYVPKNRIAVKTFKTPRDRICYFKGEVNDDGNPDGLGLVMHAFCEIQEGYWKDGRLWGEQRRFEVDIHQYS